MTPLNPSTVNRPGHYRFFEPATVPAYEDTVVLLDQLCMFGMKLGLDNTLAMLAAVDNPQNQCRFVHVAGTNGKGSVCNMLAAALAGAGLRTGLFTSPHLITLRERFRCDGENIGEEELGELAMEVRQRCDSLFDDWAHGGPTFFEFVTVVGLLFFQRRQVDIAVLETGLGGRLDSTNVVTPEVSVITTIGADHGRYLGSTPAEIAAEKAGIIKPGVSVVSGVVQEAAAAVIKRKALEHGSTYYARDDAFALDSWRCTVGHAGLSQRNRIYWRGQLSDIITPLAGPHQGDNAAVAWATLNVLSGRLKFSLDKACIGMEKAECPARLQVLTDGTLLDAAHNPDGAAALAAALESIYPDRKWSILFAVLDDKDWQGMLQHLLPLCRRLICVATASARSVPADVLADTASALVPDLSVTASNSLAAALAELGNADTDSRLITGSIYLAGEVLADTLPIAGIVCAKLGEGEV